MNKINIIMKNIKNNLYSSDEELLNEAMPLYKYLNKKIPRYKDYYVQLKGIEKDLSSIIFNNLTTEEQIIFFIRLSLIKINDNRFYHFNNFISSIFRNYIRKRNKEFLQILKNNDNIQKLYLKWFKEKEYNSNFSEDFYSEIFNLPKFKEIILEDEQFILENFFLSIDFYKKLPKEYGYLIGLIKAKNIPIKTTLNIYNKYFDNMLKKSDQLKLLKTAILMNNTDYSFEIENTNKRLEYAHCLKKIYKNKEYYNILKKLNKKTKLDLRYIISFADKYDNTNFFINICSKKKLTKDEINKIKYLSISEKIISNDTINKLDNLDLNSLINAEKDENTKIGIYGGPNSKSNKNPLFSIDSSSKEIRRINYDGSIDIKKLESYGSHSLGVDLIYPEIEFSYDESVFEKAITAIKEFNSITFIIEEEACLIVMSKNISNKQKNILTNWINESKKESNIAINIYDKATDKNEMLLCNEIGKKDIIKYISNLNSIKKTFK